MKNNKKFEWSHLVENGIHLIVLMAMKPSSERPNGLYILAMGEPNGKKYKYGYMGEPGDLIKHSGFICDDVSEKMLELALQELEKWVVTRQIMES